MYPEVTLTVVSDNTETRSFRDNSTNTFREYQSRTITGITSSSALVTVAVPERLSPSIPHASGEITLQCTRIEVVRGIWQCVATGVVA